MEHPFYTNGKGHTLVNPSSFTNRDLQPTGPGSTLKTSEEMDERIKELLAQKERQALMAQHRVGLYQDHERHVIKWKYQPLGAPSSIPGFSGDGQQIC